MSARETLALEGQQNRRLKTMLNLAIQINSSLDLNTVLTNIMSAAEETTGAEASSLFLLDEEANELVFVVATGEKGEEVKKRRLKRGQGIAGRVIETGKPELWDDVRKAPGWGGDVPGFTTRNLLCVPLRVKDKVIGAVQVLNKRDGGSFSEEDLEELTALAALSAIAVDKAQTHKELEDMFRNIVRVLTASLDARDPYTAGHSSRVTEFTLAIAEEMGLGEEDLKRLELSALLHDIGKVGIKDVVLRKPGKLSPEEFEEIKKHPEIGYRILRIVPQLRGILDGVRFHHEGLSGNGYPLGLKGEQIPLDAKIISVADKFDALTSDRPYREGFQPQKAIEIIREMVGKEVDGEVFNAFLRAYQKGKIIEQRRRGNDKKSWLDYETVP